LDCGRRARAEPWRRALLAWFDAILPDVLESLEHGETLIEVI
jgi:hypothetical protein